MVLSVAMGGRRKVSAAVSRRKGISIELSVGMVTARLRPLAFSWCEISYSTVLPDFELRAIRPSSAVRVRGTVTRGDQTAFL